MAYVNGKNGYFEFQDDNKQFTWRVNWTEIYDIELNTSIVSVSIDIKSRVYNDYWYPNCLIKVNGEQLCEMNYYNPPTHYVYCRADDTTWKPIVKNGGYGKVELPVDSSPIEHDADGSKSIIIAIEANPVKNDTTIQLYNGTYGRKIFGTSQTQTVALTNIPRRANLTVENGTLGVTQTLGVTRYYNGFTHSITCTIGSETKTICEKDTATAYTWTPPMELAKQIPNAEKGAAIYKISTYNGDTLIGSQEVQAELTVPDNILPTVSATWSDPTGAKDKMGSLVKMVSTLSVDIVGVGAYGSTITGASMTLNGKAYAGGVIMDAGNIDLVVAVNDSRGRKGSTAYTIDVADYAVPSIRLDASRCQEDGTADEMGEFARVTVTGNVVQVNEANTATLQLTYGSTTEGYELDPGTIEHVQIIPAPSVSTLTIAATLTDRLQSATQSMVLSIGYATLDFLAGGQGIAFGTTAKRAGFDCHMDTDFGGHAVTGLPEPKQDSDAVPKSYVDKLKVEAKEPLRYTEQGVLEIQLAEEPTDGSKLPITAGAVYSALNAESRAPKILQVEAATPVSVDMTDGEIYAISYVTSYTGTGDIFLKVNEAAPKVAGYTFSGGAGNYTGGIITFSGGTSSATFFGFVQVINGRVNVWGNGIRGNGTGHGWATAYWVAASVTSLTFTRAGTLTIQKL